MSYRLCIQCKTNPPRSETSDFCEACWKSGPKKARPSLLSPAQSGKLNKLIAKRKPKAPQIIEENWGGPCGSIGGGGCGKRVVGEFYCYDCRKKKAEGNYALNPGEVELYRGNVGKVEDKFIKQVVAIDATSIKATPMTWLWKDRIPDGAITWVVGQAPHAPWDIAPVIAIGKSAQSYAFAPPMSALHASPQKSQTPFAFSSAMWFLPADVRPGLRLRLCLPYTAVIQKSSGSST
jgi:hypothetical protein